MIRAAFALAALLALPAAAQAADGTRLGGTLETAFRACALQVSSSLKPGGPLYLGDPAKVAELKTQGIAATAALPEAYAIGIASDNYGAPTVATLTSPDAALWLVGYGEGPVCKVLIGDTTVAPTARSEFERRFAATTSWSKDPASRVEGPLFIQIFTLNAARPGPHLVVKLEGPGAPFNDGRGIQAIMTVALIKPEAN